MSDLDTFRSRVDATFDMHLGGHTQPLVLRECETRDGEGSFDLTFVGGPGVPAEQGTYLLSADGLEPMPVFLVPIHRDSAGVAPHAAFNQIERGAR